MDINTILNYIDAIPTYGWVIIVIVILFFFGDRKKWEYEVHLPYQADIGHGEVEIECWSSKISKRERKNIEVELTLEPAAQNRSYEVLLNGESVLNLSPADTSTSRVRVQKKYLGSKPSQGDTVEIQCNKETVFTGPLVKD